MRTQVLMLSIVSLVALGNSTSAEERTYGGYECTDDCSGHAAGYEWAKEHEIDDDAKCHLADRDSVVVLLWIGSVWVLSVTADL